MRLLIIGNKIVNDSAYKKILKQSYIVDFTHSGIEGSSMANATPYDVILVEDTVPDMDGIEVCKSIRSYDILTPIIYINSKANKQAKTLSLDSGADVCITCFAGEPEINEVCSQIRSLLRRVSLITHEVICHGAVKVDLSSGSVFVDDVRLDLRRKEFDILAYLILMRNKIVTKEALLEHVWDIGLEARSNIVEVHVKQLRDKLEKYCGRTFIKTVRNFGYTLVC